MGGCDYIVKFRDHITISQRLGPQVSHHFLVMDYYSHGSLRNIIDNDIRRNNMEANILKFREEKIPQAGIPLEKITKWVFHIGKKKSPKPVFRWKKLPNGYFTLHKL